MGYNSTINDKIGKCVDCVLEGDETEKPIVAGRCKYGKCHYQKYRTSIQRGKIKLIAAVRRLSDPSNFSTIKKQSDKLKADLKIYEVLRKDYLIDHPKCEAELKGCKVKAEEIHHKKGRGKNLNNVETFLSVCRNCHHKIEMNPTMAKEFGLSESRLHKN